MMRTVKRKGPALLALLAFTSLVVAGGWYFFSLPRQYAEVDAGILYRSGQGRGNQFANAIRRHRIKTIVCLREPNSEKDRSWLAMETEAARSNGVELILRPTDSHREISEQDQVSFLRLTQDPGKRPILLHCAEGKHRTGFYVALYRMVINGWPFGRAIKEMDSFDYDLASHEELLESLRKVDPDRLRKQYQFKNHAPVMNRDIAGLVFKVGLWTVFGFVGQFFFFSRFLVQWIATEKRGRTHVPVAFWYLSLLGGTILTVYAIGRADIVITLGQGLGCLIYIRNLMIIRRNQTNGLVGEAGNAG